MWTTAPRSCMSLVTCNVTGYMWRYASCPDPWHAAKYKICIRAVACYTCGFTAEIMYSQFCMCSMNRHRHAELATHQSVTHHRIYTVQNLHVLTSVSLQPRHVGRHGRSGHVPRTGGCTCHWYRTDYKDQFTTTEQLTVVWERAPHMACLVNIPHLSALNLHDSEGRV